MDLDTAAVDHVLTTTRSVRRRLDLDRPVEREVILDCIRIASQAPTASNTQLWRWMVVTDPAKKKELARLYREAGEGYLSAAAGRAGNSGDAQTARVYNSAMYLVDVLERVPVLVIPCLVGRVDGADTATAAGFYGSIMPAAWSFCLALRARGLGSAWTSLHLRREKEAAELLGIPADVTQVALLPVAYTIGTDFKPAARPPVETIVSFDTWTAPIP